VKNAKRDKQETPSDLGAIGVGCGVEIVGSFNRAL
jgi:hypothetical protein